MCCLFTDCLDGVEFCARFASRVCVSIFSETELLDQHAQILFNRGVEGFITVDTYLNHALPLPTIAVADIAR